MLYGLLNRVGHVIYLMIFILKTRLLTRATAWVLSTVIEINKL